MSGKYEFIRLLGEGESSSVFLARHLYLDAELAIKVSPKHLTSANWIFTEGKLLKSLNHPGIPKVFDIEQDQDNYYLIEEFIEGESFLELISHQTVISLTDFYSYALQLCDLFAYLHRVTHGQYFYQDLKPEHVILCNDRIRLIDFCLSRNLGESTFISGNSTYSAPEALRSEALNCQSDVYTIGSFLSFIFSQMVLDSNPLIFPILDTATSQDANLRYETVEEFRQALLQTQNVRRASCKTIAVVGSYHGCGVTHFSIAMTSVLNSLGYSSFYREENDSDSLRKLTMHARSLRKKNGIYYTKHFTGLPRYGPGLSLDLPDSEYCIIDYGINVNNVNFYSSDILVLLCDGSPWRIQESIEMNDILFPYRDKLKVICLSHFKKYNKTLAKSIGSKVFSFYDYDDAFLVTPEKRLFFKQLLNL